jgi:thiamine-phosphate pyrophosphorylase
MTERLRGLYVITDHALSVQRKLPLVDMVEAAIRGGARIVQYRNKISPMAERQREARALAALCKSHNVLFLINDDVSLALAIDADGVHLGQSDTDLTQARDLLGEQRIIGATCHNQLALALAAQHAGADYVAFGRFFTSVSKPEAPPASLATLQQAHEQLSIPIAAIGGITPVNAPALLAHGAAMLAVIHGVFGAPDIAAAAGEYAHLFTLQSSHANQTGG